MLEVRVKELQNQAHRDSTHNESLNARLVHFLRKEAVKKEVAGKEAAEKEATEKEASEKEVAEEDNDDEEHKQALPSRSSDDDGPVRPIGFPIVMHLLKCPIFLNYLYEHKNGLLLHIESFIKDEMQLQTWLNNISMSDP
jgi:hypothetical protein